MREFRVRYRGSPVPSRECGSREGIMACPTWLGCATACGGQSFGYNYIEGQGSIDGGAV